MKETPRDLADLGAEWSVLGACIIDPDAFDKIEDVLSVDDFHWEGHQIVFEALGRLREGQANVDLMLLSRMIGEEKLQQVHSGNESKGYNYLVKMADATPTALNVVHYAEIVRRLSTLRKLMTFAGSVAKTAYSADGVELDKVFEIIRTRLDTITPEVEDEHILYWDKSLVVLPALQEMRRKEAEEIEAGRQKPRPSLPWYALGKFVKNWLREGTLTVIGADYSTGKTAMLECFAEYWAMLGLQVAFFHLEISHAAMMDRRTCRWSGVPMEEIERGVENAETVKAAAKIRAWPGGIHYIHSPGWSAQRIVQQARALHGRGICDVLIVDYFQKIREVQRPGMNKAQNRGADAEVLKTLGEQLGMCVVAGSQINRAQGELSGKRLRDTGELPEKANLVILLERVVLKQDYKENGKVIAVKGDRSPSTTVVVDKNTFGPTGRGQLLFIGPRFCFVDPFKERKKEPLNL